MRRRYDPDKNEKGINVTVKMPKSVVEEIDRYWRENNLASRSHFIEKAARAYLNVKICPRCGAANPANGVVCSVCGTDIEFLKKMLPEFEMLYREVKELKDGVCASAHLSMREYQDFIPILQNIEKKSPDNREVSLFIIPRVKKQQERLEAILNQISGEDEKEYLEIGSEIAEYDGVKYHLHFKESLADTLETARALIEDASSFIVLVDGEFVQMSEKERIEEVKRYTKVLHEWKVVLETISDDIGRAQDIYHESYNQLRNYLKNGTEPTTAENTKP
ncbi:MAG: ribbon-helix-helix protein, CopG family [Methanocorpusculum sp.]|nr:ribbon-helix-helix protein, CopG family [Methanocorpusculum sp.]